MAKGKKGLGSVFQLKNGKWRGQIEVGYKDGRRLRKTVTGRTSTEVTEKLKDLHVRARTGQLEPVDSESLRAFLYEWLESAVKPHRAYRTYEQYELTIRNHLLDHLGSTKLHELTPQKIQRAIGELMRTDGNGTARSAGKTLKTALNRAVKWGLIPTNPMAMVDLPSVRVKEAQIWTPEQARAFLDACEGHEFGPIFTLILTLALRKGEALALQWPDIDLERRTISIRGTLERRDSSLVRKPPKTPNSVRVLHLPYLALRALEKAQEARTDSEWVFHTSKGKPLAPQYLIGPFHELIEQAGVPRITIHSLRHTCASILILRGMPIPAVSKWLGHNSVVITMAVYSHALPNSNRDLAQEVDSIFG